MKNLENNNDGAAPNDAPRTELSARKREPEFDATFIRDLSELAYRQRLVDESGEGSCERMIAHDKDNGEGLRRRAAAYDALTRAYMRITAAAAFDLLSAMKAARDQTNAVQHSQETRLNDIYDILNEAIIKVEGLS